MTALRQRMIQDMQLRGLAKTTQRSYLHMSRNSRTTFRKARSCSTWKPCGNTPCT